MLAAQRRRRFEPHVAAAEVGLGLRCPAVRLGGAEVVGGRDVKLLRRRRRRLLCWHGPRVGLGSEAGRVGTRVWRRALLEVCQPARLGAVCCTVGLLVAGEAELVCPEVEGHGYGLGRGLFGMWVSMEFVRDDVWLTRDLLEDEDEDDGDDSALGSQG